MRIKLTILLFSVSSSLFSQTLSFGNSHAFFVCPDSSIKAWGLGTLGQLGNGNNANTNTAVSVSNLTQMISIASGGVEHAVAIKSDSTVWSWGFNNNGQLGDSTVTASNVPLQVHGENNIGFLNGVTTLAKGHAHHHNLVIRNDSTVWAWGFNLHGQLGDSTLIDKRVPVKTRYLSDITKIAAGDVHSLAIDKDSALWVWGYNSSGQLGDSTIVKKIVPIKNNFISKVTDVSAGEIFSIALRSDSTVWTWGYNFYGQLGDGSNVNSLVPIQVPGLTGIISVATGQEHSLALKSDGTVWAWGLNYYGQLGDSTATDRWYPVQVKGINNVIEITGGGYNSMALKNDGTVWVWGMGNFGQLGNATQGTPPCNCATTPVEVWGPCNVLTEVNEEEEQNLFDVYPNPSNGIFTVSPGLLKKDLLIYNILGEIIYKSEVGSHHPARIDITNQRSGLYFLKTETGLKKLVVSR